MNNSNRLKIRNALLFAFTLLFLPITSNAVECEDEQGCSLKVNRLVKFARNGSPNAQMVLAAMLSEGRFVKKDLEMSFYWYKRASRFSPGIGAAHYEVSMSFLNGTGVEQDIRSGLKYLEKAADLNYPRALVLQGRMFYSGLYVDKDMVRAKESFIKAAELEDPTGAYSLAQMYERGEGGERDLALAKKFYLLALKKSHVKAREALSKLELIAPELFNSPEQDIVDSGQSVESTLVVYGSELSDEEMLTILLENEKQYATKTTGSRIAGPRCGKGNANCRIVKPDSFWYYGRNNVWVSDMMGKSN